MKARHVALAIVGSVLLAVVGGCNMLVVLIAGVSGLSGNQLTTGCPSGGTDPGNLTPEQQQVVQTIVTVGQRLQVPQKGIVVALVTARQESGWRNLPSGSGSSVGVFQQDKFWAPSTVRRDPVQATRMFFQGGRRRQKGLLAIQGWQAMSVAEAAQSVQHSRYPGAYARWEGAAVAVLTKLLGQAVANCQPDTNPVPVSGRLVSVSGIVVDSSIAANLSRLLADARRDGIVLSGSGWRSTAQQAALKRAKPGLAASPGHSMHEKGLAIDFTENGRALTESSPGYRWLKAHSTEYGLKNLDFRPSGLFEPWHYSVNGN